MDIVGLFAQNLALCMILITGLFIIAVLRNRRYDLIDVGWGLMFILIAAFSLLISGVEFSGILLLGMVVVWGLRLAAHILRRWLASSQEDPRYEELRSKWPKGGIALRMYLRIYLMQALLACLVALPVMVFMQAQPDFTWHVGLGLGLWIVGFVFEVAADRQLSRFLANPKNKGKLMTSGLW